MNIRSSLLVLALSVGAAVFAAPAAFADPMDSQQDSHQDVNRDANHDIHDADRDMHDADRHDADRAMPRYTTHYSRHRAVCVRYRHERCVQWSRRYRR
jgi:Ni/Co efflux regulator RcnB